jgi:methionyl-tRNA synthetase
VIAEDLQQPRAVLRPVHPHDHPNHYAVVQEMFRACSQRLHGRQDQLGAISPSTGRTLPDRYIEGTCPICGYDGARGDQCDNCGNQLDPIDLINPAPRSTARRPSSSRPSTSSSTCRRSPTRSASGSRAGPLAPERAEVQL